MKRRYKLIFAIVSAFTVLAMFPTWDFDEQICIAQPENPLWSEQVTPIDSALTEALQDEGLSFHTGRGAEAGSDGICYGDFASDEYWVVQYDSESNEVDAFAFLAGINWIGHVKAQRRFARIREILRKHLGT